MLSKKGFRPGLVWLFEGHQTRAKRVHTHRLNHLESPRRQRKQGLLTVGSYHAIASLAIDDRAALAWQKDFRSIFLVNARIPH